MTVAELAQKRKGARVTQRSVAARLGLNTETVTDIELGRVEISERAHEQFEQVIAQLVQEKADGKGVSAVV